MVLSIAINGSGVPLRIVSQPLRDVVNFGVILSFVLLLGGVCFLLQLVDYVLRLETLLDRFRGVETEEQRIELLQTCVKLELLQDLACYLVLFVQLH